MLMDDEAIPVHTVADLGAAVRGLRLRQGWSQQQLGDAAGVSRRWVSELERGKRRGELERVLAVLEALRVGLQLVVTGDRPDPLEALEEGPW